MDQVLLEWGGGESMVLARFRDAGGCWLSTREMYTKLGSKMSLASWHTYTHSGEHTS